MKIVTPETLEKDLAPVDGKCELAGCGAHTPAQQVFLTNGLHHCWHHRFWPESDAGQETSKRAAFEASLKK